MKKILLLSAILLTSVSMNARTLRVNNNVGSGAPYTSVADAMKDCIDGDVLILEASSESYGDFAVDKKVTIKGEGYFLDINGLSQTGAAGTTVGTVTVKAENVTIMGININSTITFKANHCTITRCATQYIELGAQFAYSDTPVTDIIIHQNFIRLCIISDSYSAAPEYIQITNNIFTNRSTSLVRGITKSVLKYNTFTYSAACCISVNDCVIEHNLGGGLSGVNNGGGNNTMAYNEHDEIITNSAEQLYTDDNRKNDKSVKEIDTELTSTAGAFAGEDPYVLSGIIPGPRVESFDVPVSVEQGQPLNVNLKIAVKK